MLAGERVTVMDWLHRSRSGRPCQPLVVISGPETYRLVDVVLGLIENPRNDVFGGKRNVSIAVEIHGGGVNLIRHDLEL